MTVDVEVVDPVTAQARIVDDKNKNVQRNLSIIIKLNGKSFLVNKKVTDGIVDVLIDTSNFPTEIIL